MPSCLEELIHNFPLTGTNCEAAWKLLNDWFDNTKGLVQYHYLTSMPTCNESADDLGRLMNKKASSLRSLTNMGRPTDTWDVTVYGIGTSKSHKAQHFVQLQLMSRQHVGLSVSVSALVLPPVTQFKKREIK